MGRLTGKFAIVTGGGSGIGRAMCQVFAKEGASVAVLDINKKGIDETLSLMTVYDETRHFAIEVDVTSVDQVESAFNMVEQEMKKKSPILVNNAGIAREGYADDVTEEDFDIVIKTNLKSVFLMTRAFLKSLKGDAETGHERGVIVNISSINAKIGSVIYPHYNASKSGVLGLTKSIAAEYPKHKVRCNAVLPGFIRTPLSDRLDANMAKKLIEMAPMGRAGQPEEVANACLFLASDESSFVHGAALEVTGGKGM